ncbi:hypothetical protein V1498_22010 [Peribacillus sp. SCS-26]|uniref:hypothetical protein n=1 Tax=Paraperibacillus marinus TaxID=3115295 RepID=UPI0039063356
MDTAVGLFCLILICGAVVCFSSLTVFAYQRSWKVNRTDDAFAYLFDVYDDGE